MVIARWRRTQTRLAELGPSFETDLTIILGKRDVRGNQQRYEGTNSAHYRSKNEPYPTAAGAAVARHDGRSAFQLLDPESDRQWPHGQYAFTQQRSYPPAIKAWQIVSACW